MNLLKYFLFYYKLTERKVLIVIALAMLSSGFQAFALAAIAAVSEYGVAADQRGQLTKAVYSVIDWIGISDPHTGFALLLIVVAVSFACSNLFIIFTNIYIVDLQNSIYKSVQKRIMNLLIHVDYEFFSSNNLGYFNNVIIAQLRAMSASFRFLVNIFVLFIAVVPFFFTAFAMNFKLALILACVLAPLILPLRWINRKTKKYSLKNVEEQTNINSLLIQILTHYKYLKATGQYNSVFERLRGVVHNVTVIAKRLVILGSLSSNAIMPVAITFICILVYWQVTVEGVPVVNAGLVLGLLYMASSRLNAVPIAYQKFVSATGSITAYEELLLKLKKNQEKSLDQNKYQADFTAPLTLKNVSLKYKSGEKSALQNISLSIEPFSSVAFVGGSGAGKSTIVNMLTGLLKPSNGTIKLGDIPYTEIDLVSLRNGIGYVTQEPVIFSDTVKANISLWDPEESDEKIIPAAQAAHAHDFIKTLPQSYNTILGDNGVNISGGQRQRISIAREFYRETPLLILDEATSALDSETEQVIQQSINEFHGKKTMIIIAHRLSTIKHCDKIFVMDEGKIVEFGSYDELIKADGLFKKMVEMQSL